MRTLTFLLAFGSWLLASGQNTIQSYEYWFNGNYESLTRQQITPVTTFQLNTMVSTASLQEGLHKFNLRFMDDSGRYSPPITQFFYKISPTAPAAFSINGYQYWFNQQFTDAVTQNVSPGSMFEFNSILNTPGLSPGLHLLHIRFRDNEGKWSSAISQFFYKMPASSSPASNLVNGWQYWFNSRFDLATTEPIIPVNPYQISGNIDLGSLPAGIHLLHLRFRDQKGQWSSVISQFVYTGMVNGSPASNAMKHMQYWFDHDLANASITPLQQQPSVQLTQLIDAAQLPDGLHMLHLRFADTIGQWSVPISQFFYKSKEIGVTNNVITGYRYWFNSEPAENIVYHRIQSVNPFHLITVLDMGCLSAGDNLLQMQFLDSAGQWSAPMADTILVTPPPNKSYRFTGNGNWSETANWLNNIKPSNDAPGCREIIIDHIAGGQCILDVPQHLLKNAKLTVLPGKILIIPGGIQTKENVQQ